MLAPKMSLGGSHRRPGPLHENVKYGPYARNVMDVWLDKSDKPTCAAPVDSVDMGE
jgi:hypothetical protein